MENKEINPKELINEFDEKHKIKQIILIGYDGAIRNIEFMLQEDFQDEDRY